MIKNTLKRVQQQRLQQRRVLKKVQKMSNKKKIDKTTIRTPGRGLRICPVSGQICAFVCRCVVQYNSRHQIICTFFIGQPFPIGGKAQ